MTKKFELGPVQRKWVDELKSGNYEQGKETLKDNKGCFCCLGVLADLTGYLNDEGCLTFDSDSSFDTMTDGFANRFEFIDGNRNKGNNTVGRIYVSKLSDKEFDKFIDFINKRGNIELEVDRDAVSDHTFSLAEFNDSGMTFENIAHIIETYPHAIFEGPV